MPNSPRLKRHDFPPGFVADILQHALGTTGKPDKPGVYGIAGLQGSGKSTLAAQLAAKGKELGLKIAVISIDDFYLGKRERWKLARKIHPLLASRGPPGTHDVSLACETLDALKKGKPVRIPRFDKIGDTRLPPARWKNIASRVDLIILEGWFLFAQPENEAALQPALNRLERDRDAALVWRRYCNQALAEYECIWRHIDSCLVLQGPGFEQVGQWRWQQEQSLQASSPRRKTMGKKQIGEFILLFERTSRNVYAKWPELADRVVQLDVNRRPCPDPKGPPASPRS